MNNLLPNNVLHKIIESSPDPILITSKDVKIIYVNPAWEKLTEYSKAEILGKNPKFIHSGKTSYRIYKRMWEKLLSRQSFISEDLINKKKSGKEYVVHSVFYPIVENDEVTHYIQMEHDITAVKHLEELRKEFLSAAAHELKTPISVLKILIGSRLKQIKKSGSGSIKNAELQLMDREIDKLTRLIDDILDSSRFEIGKQNMFFQRTNLPDLVRRTVEEMRVYGKNHTIILNTLAEHAYVIADPGRIEQVVLNLLSNAIKYSHEDTTITVTLEIKRGQVVVSVKDEGIGISKSKQKLIFDRYYQVKTKSKIGFGLGLYISKEIIKRHRGKIWVTSNGKDGSVFSFSLPLSRD